MLEKNEPYAIVAITQNTADVANVKDKMKGVWLSHTLLGYQPAGKDMGLYKRGLDDGIGGWLYWLGVGTGRRPDCC